VHIKLRGFTDIILLVVLCSYLPKTLFRRLSNYSQAPLSVIPRPLAKNLHYVPLSPDPEPRGGTSSCTCWVPGLLMAGQAPSSISPLPIGPEPSSIVHYTSPPGRCPRQMVVSSAGLVLLTLDSRVLMCYCIILPSLFS